MTEEPYVLYRRMPDRVYEDLQTFISEREEDILLGMEDFGLLQSVLAWITYKEKGK